ncbi:lytic murein transglycosylase [Sphingomonas zeicaulis]|uniref:lytic murein transglycosylase n=1 Tax=Sphingomonas zeicaulis TaxID=1632740 RepID=UPI003D1F1FAA
MRIKSFLAALAFAAVLPSADLGSGHVALAQEEAGFQAWLAQFRVRAEREGVSRRTLDSVLPTLTLNPRVIALDRDQPGGNPNAPAAAIPAFEPYRVRHVDAARISRGRAKYNALRPKLGSIERQTGVPESIMVAIWGHETNYGAFSGDFDLARSLATLAYEGRRRELFTGELIATLKLMDMGFRRDQLKGSWAGATGYPQFLPSMYLRLARDGDGDGRADIWSSEADALASIANYFVNAGWKPGVPWGVAATVPSTLNRGAIANRTVSPRCPRVHDRHSRWKTIAEWRALGVRPIGAPVPADTEMASLLEPDGPGRTAYLLTGNYRVILDYNCSNFYALSVGLLADAVRQ